MFIIYILLDELVLLSFHYYIKGKKKNFKKNGIMEGEEVEVKVEVEEEEEEKEEGGKKIGSQVKLME